MHQRRDVSVRPALESDAHAIGAIHAAALKRDIALATSSGEVVAENAGITDQRLAGQWLYSISEPPTRQHIVLSALDKNTVVGFAALAPIDDPDSDQTTMELIALEVGLDDTGAGHGSRLLNASVDVAAQKGATKIVVWVPSECDWRTKFYSSAGFAPAGHTRKLDIGDGTLSQHLWYTLIGD